MKSQNNSTCTPNIQSRTISEATIYSGKTIGIKHLSYSIGQKVYHEYQSVYRIDKKEQYNGIDAVDIIPIIKYKQQKDQIVFIANFRPPVNQFVLEMPSGYVQCTNFQDNARRQMLEETGYVIDKFVQIPYPGIYYDPWKTTQKGHIYIGYINGDDPYSKQDQQLDHDQNIRIYILPMDKDLPSKVAQIAKINKYGIQGKFWTFCLSVMLKQNL